MSSCVADGVFNGHLWPSSDSYQPSQKRTDPYQVLHGLYNTMNAMKISCNKLFHRLYFFNNDGRKYALIGLFNFYAYGFHFYIPNLQMGTERILSFLQL